MILDKKKTVPDISQKNADLSKGNGSGDIRENKQEDATMWGNKGNSLVESSMYDDAIKCYDKALEINPGSMEAWNNKGLALARTGRLAEAVQCYDKALEIKADDSEVMYNKGISLALLGKSKEAIECYDKLLAANPGDADAWCSKGDVLFEGGRHEEALEAYNKSIEIFPKDEVTWNNRGMTLIKLNRFAEGIESYDKALEVNPKVEKIWSNKGLAIAKMEESKDKVDLQKLAAALPREDKIPLVSMQPAGQPDTEPAKQENAPLNNQMTEGEVNMAQVIEAPLSGHADIIPDIQCNPGMHSPMPEMPVEGIGQDAIYKATDVQADTSVKPVDKAASATGTPPQSQIQQTSNQAPEEVKTAPADETHVLGQVDIQTDILCTKPESTGKEELIINDASNIEKCLVSVPVDAYIVNPFISKPASDHAATKADDEGTNPQPEDKTAPAVDTDILKLSEEHLIMGNTLYSQGKYEDAIECFNKSLQMHLGNNTAWNNKGLALSKTGKFDEAIRCYDKALVIGPKDYVVLNNKGSALYKNGEIQRAMQCYKDALELNPGSKTAKRGVNICIESLNKPDRRNKAK